MSKTTWWKVTQYQNTIREVRRGETDRWANYFESEAEAVAFLIGRAEEDVKTADAEAKKARARLAKLRMKYGTPEATR